MPQRKHVNSRSRILALLGFLVPAAGSFAQATITGLVQVRPVERSADRSLNSAYGSRLAARPSGQKKVQLSEAQNVIVFIKEAIPGSYAPPANPPQMEQIDATFVPRVLPVLQGTTVSFPNLDPVFHNVFSLSRNAKFNLGRYPRPKTKLFTFDRPGMVRVNCDIHADMLGFVLVLPHSYFATPQSNGSYQIPSVPAGRYHLVAWHDTLPPKVREIAVPASGSLRADFQF